MARTCDLGQVVGLATDAASGAPPVLVAVSGFAASGKTTLASRLHERISGSAVVEADLLADTPPLRMTEPAPDWPGYEEFDRHGYLLSRELQDALGPDYEVTYSFSTAEARQWAARRD